MAASIMGLELGGVTGQAKIDLLLVGDVTVCYLADDIQKFFPNSAEVTITISDMKKAATLLDDCTFDMVFLRITSFLTAEELEAVKSIRFGKKKNTDLLFIFVIPENFKGCISGHGVDVTLTEPLTREKLTIVVKYWKMCFSNTGKKENAARPEEHGSPLLNSCSEHLGYFSTDVVTCSESLRNDIGLGFKVPSSELEKNKQISFLHSSKEKLRRERMKYCCEQLRILLPYSKGRKNDSASILEATVDYVKYVREKIPPAAMSQVVNSQRENSVLASTYSPVRGLQFLANKRLNVFSLPATGSPLDEAVRGQSSSTSESAIGDLYKTRIPSAALSLSSFHAVRYYSKVVPSYDEAAVTNQNIPIHLPSAVPKVSKFLPQHSNLVLSQTCTTHPNCLVGSGHSHYITSLLPASIMLISDATVLGILTGHV